VDRNWNYNQDRRDRNWIRWNLGIGERSGGKETDGTRIDGTGAGTKTDGAGSENGGIGILE